MYRHELTDAEWKRIEALLPVRRGPVSKRGDRDFVNALIWRTNTGVSWRDLPERFGSWKTVYNRSSRLAKTGVWERLFKELAIEVTVGLVITVLTGGGGTAPTFRVAASTWINNIIRGSMTAGPFTTTGSPRVLVAVVSWYSPSNDTFPATLAWSGSAPPGASAWTRVIESTEGTIHWGTQIWWATTTSTLTDVSVTATRASPADRSTAIFVVYEVTGARTTWGASAEHHSTGIEVGQNVRVTSVVVPITATAANSQIIGISQYGDFYINSTANALTTIDYQQTDGGSDGGAAAWHKTTPTSANVQYTLGVSLVGDTGNTRAFSGCAVEVLAP